MVLVGVFVGDFVVWGGVLWVLPGVFVFVVVVWGGGVGVGLLLVCVGVWVVCVGFGLLGGVWLVVLVVCLGVVLHSRFFFSTCYLLHISVWGVQTFGVAYDKIHGVTLW
ncbi:hypothetical protein RA274_27665, partial [Pseudomonas syringae pv. tagetis]